MSTYVISDIHGEYQKLMKLLKKISFDDSDTLYLLGDIVDRGKFGLKILQYAMLKPNIVPIIGNHEYMSLQSLRWLSSEITEENIAKLSEEFLLGFQEWLNVGGQATVDEFRILSKSEQEDILEYLNEFNLYEEITINDRNFVLVHAGLDNSETHKHLDDYGLHEMIFNKPFYFMKYFDDKYLITGHTPTRYIREEELNLPSGTVDNSGNKYDKIYKTNNHIAIDCGCSYGGLLGAIRLDDFQEFYV